MSRICKAVAARGRIILTPVSDFRQHSNAVEVYIRALKSAHFIKIYSFWASHRRYYFSPCLVKIGSLHYTPLRDVSRSNALGISTYLVKPVSMENLRETISD